MAGSEGRKWKMMQLYYYLKNKFLKYFKDKLKSQTVYKGISKMAYQSLCNFVYGKC